MLRPTDFAMTVIFDRWCGRSGKAVDDPDDSTPVGEGLDPPFNIPKTALRMVPPGCPNSVAIRFPAGADAMTCFFDSCLRILIIYGGF